MWGAEATEQGNCSAFKNSQLPHCCERKPVIVDLMAGAPYNVQSQNCCKGGVLTSMIQDISNHGAIFEMNVGGSSSGDFVMPENFTLGITGYSCVSKAVEVPPNTVCHGVDTLNTETLEVVRFISKVTVLASGGAGDIYPSTTNPQVATGDGIAMAHRAQAVVTNMEFVQFHPTALADEGLLVKPRKARENVFLITEAVRGDGGILYNLDMERFMSLYDERGELAPSDVVARDLGGAIKNTVMKKEGMHQQTEE